MADCPADGPSSSSCAFSGTTVLSSDGIHSVVGYATSIILLGGFLSMRRRAEVNDFLHRMDKYTAASRDPQVRYKSSSAPCLYAILAILVVHSACLSYTTSVLHYKIIVKVSKVIPLPSDNTTSTKKASDPSSSKGGMSGNGLGLGIDNSVGDVGFDAEDAPGAGGEGDGDHLSRSMPHVEPEDGDEGEQPADDGEADDEDHQARRRRRSAARFSHRLAAVQATVVEPSQVFESDAEDVISDYNETVNEPSDLKSGEKVRAFHLTMRIVSYTYAC